MIKLELAHCCMSCDFADIQKTECSQQVIEKELKKFQYPADRVEIIDAPEVIDMGEPPVMAIRKVLVSSGVPTAVAMVLSMSL